MAIIIIRTLVVYFALVISMRLMGKRQLSELELPELAIAVLIADLAAHPLQDIGIPLMNGLLPIVVLSCCEIIISRRGLAACRTADAALWSALLSHTPRRNRPKGNAPLPPQPRGTLRRAAHPEHHRRRSCRIRRARNGRDAISHPLSRVPPGYSTGPRPRATGHGLSRHHHKRRKAHARKPPPRRKRRGLAAAGTQKARGLRAGGRLPPAARQCGRGLLRRQRRWSDEAGACGGGRAHSAAGGQLVEPQIPPRLHRRTQ